MEMRSHIGLDIVCGGDGVEGGDKLSATIRERATTWNSAAMLGESCINKHVNALSDFWLSLASLLSCDSSMQCQSRENPEAKSSSILFIGKA